MKNGPYELVIAPEGYPGKKYRGRYAYEHHVVWWKKHKTVPSKGEVIHHKNHDTRDNRLSNLELMTKENHTLSHAIKNINIFNFVCDFCGSISFLSRRQFIFNVKSGQRMFFCSRRCGQEAPNLKKSLRRISTGRKPNC